jgi:hypothetical protein
MFSAARTARHWRGTADERRASEWPACPHSRTPPNCYQNFCNITLLVQRPTNCREDGVTEKNSEESENSQRIEFVLRLLFLWFSIILLRLLFFFFLHCYFLGLGPEASSTQLADTTGQPHHKATNTVPLQHKIEKTQTSIFWTWFEPV